MKSTNWTVPVGLAAVGITAAAVYIRRWWVRNLPPGPWGVPFLGVKYRMKPELHLECMKMRSKYGAIQSFYIGDTFVVVLNGYDLIKEAFLTRVDDFADRPPMNKEFIKSNGDEIFLAQYSDAQKQSKAFAMKALKAMGLGKACIEDKLLNEIQVVIERLKASSGQPMDLEPIVFPALARIILSTYCNKHCQDGDPEVQDFIGNARTVFSTGLKVPPFLFHSLSSAISRWIYPEFYSLWQALAVPKTFIKDQIEEHRLTFDPDNIRDIIDLYLKERIGPDLDVDLLARTILMLIPNAIDSIGTAILWGTLYMAHFPQIQRRVHEELDRVVGRIETPRLKHKQDLTYLEATLLEVNRITSMFPFAAAHKPCQDTTLAGYFIPEYSFVFGNMYSVHHDPQIFPNPEIFDPEKHFMDEKGNIINSEYALPFSLGRRSCPGEQYSRMQIYLYMSNLLHQFTFTINGVHPTPTLEPYIFGGITMMIMSAVQPGTKIRAIPR